MAKPKEQNNDQDIKNTEQASVQDGNTDEETIRETVTEDTPQLLSIQQEDIRVLPGEVIFDQLPSFKLSVERFVEKMKTVEVTEDNMAQSKQLVARTRKEVNFIDEERKRVEKFYLEPMNKFKADIKTLNAQVTEAEDYVRNQVRQLENEARDEKEEEIHEIFDRHAPSYDLKDILGFTDFFRPQYANKTFSLNKAEEETVEWLNKVENDLDFLAGLEDSDKLVAEYKDTKDVTIAIRNVENTRKYYEELERKLKAKEAQESTNADYRKTKQEYLFEIQGSDVADLVERLLNDNGIKFKRRVK